MAYVTLASHLWYRPVCLARAAALLLLLGSGGATVVVGDEPAARQRPSWVDRPALTLSGLVVTPSEPVLVARSRSYLWFPNIVRLASGDLLALMQNHADVHVTRSTCEATWSQDGGLTWSKPVEAIYGDSNLRLASGDQILMPFYLQPAPRGALGGEAQVNPRGKRTLEVRKGLTFTGLPRKDKSLAPATGNAGFFFNGSAVQLRDGAFLATLYGTFEGDARYSLVAATSRDGVKWRFRSIVASATVPVPGKDGPSESATVRLKDGRLFCVFRMGDGSPLGQAASEDEGITWSRTTAMAGPFSVQPGMVCMADGTLAISSGRPGLFLWLDPVGDGQSWQKVDLAANHDAALPKEPLSKTTAYTEVVALDDSHLLVIYDRIPHGWEAIPGASPETNSCWVVRLTVQRTGR